MRVAVVAGPDPGHAFPAIALGLRFLANGDSPTVLTGTRWLDTAEEAGLGAMELLGLDVTEDDDDTDAGEKINRRAARMAVLNAPRIAQLAPDLVVSDVITVAGGFAAELLGLPWIELNPQPLYRPSKGLPPIGSGLAPGTGVRGRIRDAVLRAMSARSWREGLRQRAAARAGIGLPAVDPGPLRRLVATLPALEVPRPDWPSEAVIVGPLHFEPTSSTLQIPAGSGPVVVVAPSTAHTGARGLAEVALDSLRPGEVLPEGSRVVVSRLDGPAGPLPPGAAIRPLPPGAAIRPLPPWAAVGLGRQDELLSKADVMICGGGHGIVSKTLLAGVPLVVVPGGGDQWEISNRVVRQGSAQLVRPLTAEALSGAVREVLSSPDYREAARRAGATLADVDDPVRVCHEAVAASA
ncbi:glycosyl transferase, UDP-glucuronosyltransferase [Mycolicibacterium rhodesiae NBB3]|uniref:Glycosyl transferase, UDP-glucuronosyltransferase n=1 Tax=Mycolicibacterium rhodesiae (strain NBB3) TaxID=710685 RepID=G8RKW1_MYCRN|nr:glycosyl transferase [Mycolicibacterium rhodesiae]AEV76088.1 glycosyl transferase, UDP-glucuronosyltransferase [Mycolicibacterium rhodesiae NBB3]